DNGSTSATVSQVVGQGTSAVGVTSSSNPSTYDTSVTFTATAVGAPGQSTATTVWGQGGSFTSQVANYPSGSVASTSLNAPEGVAVDGSGNIYIADRANNRVLYYAAGSTTATRVYGQAGSYTCAVARNNGSCSGGAA